MNSYDTTFLFDEDQSLDTRTNLVDLLHGRFRRSYNLAYQTITEHEVRRHNSREGIYHLEDAFQNYIRGQFWTCDWEGVCTYFLCPGVIASFIYDYITAKIEERRCFNDYIDPIRQHNIRRHLVYKYYKILE